MKAQTELLTGLAMAFAAVIIMGIMTYVFQNQILGSATVQQDFNASPTAVHVLKSGSGFFTAVDTVIAFLYIFIALGALIAAAMTESNIVFSAIAILMLPIELVASFGFHDAFFSLIQNSVFGGFVAQYPVLLLTFQYLPAATLILSFLIIVFTFAKG